MRRVVQAHGCYDVSLQAVGTIVYLTLPLLHWPLARTEAREVGAHYGLLPKPLLRDRAENRIGKLICYRYRAYEVVDISPSRIKS